MKRGILLLAALSLVSCSGFFDKDNTPAPTPLVNFPAEISPALLWSTHVNSGVGTQAIKLSPALLGNQIITADYRGVITATNKTTGRTLWQTKTKHAISAGVYADEGLVLVGTQDGNVLAFHAENGQPCWSTKVATEILATPVVRHGVVIAKAINGQITALDAATGLVKWRYQQNEPSFILRGASAPQFQNNSVLIGFANANLVKLNLNQGNVAWEVPVSIPQGSFAVQRMVDIDANPYIFENKVYVATYQGHIAALNIASGNVLWSQQISSYTGLAVDNNRVYITDASGGLWAFDASNGHTIWHQTKLNARVLSAPASMQNAIVVGDAEGYLHWVSKMDGHFIARVKLNNGLNATPVVEGNIAYILTMDGHLSAYRV